MPLHPRLSAPFPRRSCTGGHAPRRRRRADIFPTYYVVSTSYAARPPSSRPLWNYVTCGMIRLNGRCQIAGDAGARGEYLLETEAARRRGSRCLRAMGAFKVIAVPSADAGALCGSAGDAGAAPHISVARLRHFPAWSLIDAYHLSETLRWERTLPARDSLSHTKVSAVESDCACR